MSAIARTNAESPHPFAALNRKLRVCVYGFIGTAVAVTIHEAAHAVALKLLFANCYPSIGLEFTSWGPAGAAYHNFQGPPMLSKIGELFGKTHSFGIVSSAGHLSICLISGLVWYQKPQNFLLANPNISLFFAGFTATLIGVIMEVYMHATDPSSVSDFTKVKICMGVIPASIFAIGCTAMGVLGIYNLKQLYKQGTANRS